jgi:hypothetical protein
MINFIGQFGNIIRRKITSFEQLRGFMDRANIAYLSQPKFRATVDVVALDGEFIVRNGEATIAISWVNSAERVAIENLIQKLVDGGWDVDVLTRIDNRLEPELLEIISAFDDANFLENSHYPTENTITGIFLLGELHRAQRTFGIRRGESQLIAAMKAESISRPQLIGYALEYYWFVREAVSLISPAIASAQSIEERDIVVDFLRSEVNHDRFLAKALSAVNFDKAQMKARQPLPSTFFLAAAISNYARQHFLSFKAILYLFERPQEEFMQLFIKQCSRLGLPDSFYLPILNHANINTSESHDDISINLLRFDQTIGHEEANLVRSNFLLILETLHDQENEIFENFKNDEITGGM